MGTDFGSFASDEDGWFDLYEIHLCKIAQGKHTLHPHRFISRLSPVGWSWFFQLNVHGYIRIGESVADSPNSLIRIMKSYPRRSRERLYFGTYDFALRYAEDVPDGERTEPSIQDKLWELSEDSRIEVGTDVGKIDLLTRNEVVEIKKVSLWKQGLGQLLAYSYYYRGYRRVLYLFGSDKREKLLEKIVPICRRSDVQVKFELVV